MAFDQFHDRHACPSCAALTTRAERAEAERDEARTALRALLDAQLGSLTISIFGIGWVFAEQAVMTARALVEGWGDA